MAGKNQKRMDREELGCIGSLISILKIRRALGSNQKLVEERRRSKRYACNGKKPVEIAGFIETQEEDNIENNQYPDRIVILKPSMKITRKVEDNEKIGYRVFLSIIKRKLRYAVKKEDQTSEKFKRVAVKKFSLMDKLAINLREGEKAGRYLKLRTDSELCEDCKKEASNISDEGSKHLSESMTRLLDRILSVPDNFSPDTSPGRISNGDFVGPSETAKGCEIKEEEGSDVSDVTQNEASSDISSGNLEDSEKGLLSEPHTPSYPEEFLPNSHTKSTENEEIVNETPGRSSPISVLDPLFSEDDVSPSSTAPVSVGMGIQPQCIRFEEYDFPVEGQGDDIRAVEDERDSVFEYVKAVIEASKLNWEELFLITSSLDHHLEPMLVQDIDFFQNQPSSFQVLLFDCVNEVLRDISYNKFGCLSARTMIWCTEDAIIGAAQEGVYWHLEPVPFPHTLDQIIGKDMFRAEKWMNHGFDIGCIGMETAEIILGELVEEIFKKCTDADPQNPFSPPT